MLIHIPISRDGPITRAHAYDLCRRTLLAPLIAIWMSRARGSPRARARQQAAMRGIPADRRRRVHLDLLPARAYPRTPITPMRAGAVQHRAVDPARTAHPWAFTAHERHCRAGCNCKCTNAQTHKLVKNTVTSIVLDPHFSAGVLLYI